MGLVIRMRDSQFNVSLQEEPFDQREISAPHILPAASADVYRPPRMIVVLLCRYSAGPFNFRSIINILSFFVIACNLVAIFVSCLDLISRTNSVVCARGYHNFRSIFMSFKFPRN